MYGHKSLHTVTKKQLILRKSCKQEKPLIQRLFSLKASVHKFVRCEELPMLRSLVLSF